MHTFTADFSAMTSGAHTQRIIRVLGAKNGGDALRAVRRHLDGPGMPPAEIILVPPGTPLAALRTESCTVAYVTATENLYQTEAR